MRGCWSPQLLLLTGPVLFYLFLGSVVWQAQRDHYVFPVAWSFIIKYSLSLVIFCVLKSTFYRINTATLFFKLMFPWCIFSTLSVSTCLTHCIWREFLLAIIEPCFCNHSVNLCLLISVFRAFSFKIITGMLVLVSIILLFVFCLFFFWFSLCFSFLILWWITWTYFRISSWLTYTVFECISLCSFIFSYLLPSLNQFPVCKLKSRFNLR